MKFTCWIKKKETLQEGIIADRISNLSKNMWSVRLVLLRVGGTVHLSLWVSRIPFLSPNMQLLFSFLPTGLQHHLPCQSFYLSIGTLRLVSFF